MIDLKHPQLALEAYLIETLQQWAAFGVDGFRCDVASLLPPGFWQAGSSATLDTTTHFSGNILADQSIIGDLNGAANPAQTTMNADKVVTATFRTNIYLPLVQRNAAP